MQITSRDYQPLAEENEGRYSWMYLDTRRNVTVGIGHRVANSAAAEALPFVEEETGQPATRDSIRAAYAAVRDAGHLTRNGADAFAAITTVRLPRAAVQTVYDRDFTDIVEPTRSNLRTVGGGLDSYPLPAQLAIVDMAFNLGPSGLYNEFTRFRNEGLAQRDFNVAARESRRRDIGERRNARTRNLLLEAARIETRHR